MGYAAAQAPGERDDSGVLAQRAGSAGDDLLIAHLLRSLGCRDPGRRASSRTSSMSTSRGRPPSSPASCFAASPLRMLATANRNRRHTRLVLLGGWSIHTAALAFSSAARTREKGANMWITCASSRRTCRQFEMVHCVAQRMPGTVAQLVGTCPGVIAVQRAAGWRAGRASRGIHPGHPGIHFPEFTEQL